MRTMDEIYDALTASLAQSGGAAVTEGGDMSLRLHAVATELFALEAQAEFVARQGFPQTAQGEYLDRHATLRGLVRGGAKKAVGALRFYTAQPAAGAISIAAGVQCRTAAGIAFVTTAAGVIPAGGSSCTVAAEAVTAGSGGNVAVETVVYAILAPAGIAGVVNDAAFSGGSDGEEDESLRSRIMDTYRALPNGANAAFYESRVRDQPGVAAVTVLPKLRGVGTVDVVFANDDGVPAADQVAQVQALLEQEREIAVDVLVRAPTTAAVNVNVGLKIAEGYSFAQVQSAAQTALAGFFTGKLLSKPVYKSQLMALMMAVEGVENCSFSAPASDRAASPGVLPVAGTVTVREV